MRRYTKQTYFTATKINLNTTRQEVSIISQLFIGHTLTKRESIICLEHCYLRQHVDPAQVQIFRFLLVLVIPI